MRHSMKLLAALVASTSLHVTVWPHGPDGPKRAWTLRCTPVAGTLPHRAAACRRLLRMTRPFRPVPKDAACTEIGFFIVTGHGISQDLITTARQQAIDFFALPDEEKMKVQRPPAKISRGYNWVGDRSIAYSMGQAAPPDIQEAFAFGPDSGAQLASSVDGASAKMYAPNIWPEATRNNRA